jgi:hypothetical protein
MLRELATAFSQLNRRPSNVIEEPPPAPRVRSEHPCGVPDCYEPQNIVFQDDRYTWVECDAHNARTLWDTKPIERAEQQIIRVQDGWRQHGTTHRPK